jgi:hypothetical protein
MMVRDSDPVQLSRDHPVGGHESLTGIHRQLALERQPDLCARLEKVDAFNLH